MFRPSVLSMRWSDVLFAHWAVDPAVVCARLPEGLAPDTCNGEAYLGIVGFRMEYIHPHGSPVGFSFPELNLRTYVTGEAGPGIYFFNLDADDVLSVAVARRLFRLPYYRAEMSIERANGGIRFRSRRTHRGVPTYGFDATCRPTGEPSVPARGSVEEFVTERFLFYADAGGQVFAGPVDHRSWPLCEADLELRENGLFEADGFERPGGDPMVHYSPGVDVTAQFVTPVDAAEPAQSG